jgi:hypothetical protein
MEDPGFPREGCRTADALTVREFAGPASRVASDSSRRRGQSPDNRENASVLLPTPPSSPARGARTRAEPVQPLPAAGCMRVRQRFGLPHFCSADNVFVLHAAFAYFKQPTAQFTRPVTYFKTAPAYFWEPATKSTQRWRRSRSPHRSSGRRRRSHAPPGRTFSRGRRTSRDAGVFPATPAFFLRGIGLLKKGALGFTRTVEEVGIMRGGEGAAGPAGDLEPGEGVRAGGVAAGGSGGVGEAPIGPGCRCASRRRPPPCGSRSRAHPGRWICVAVVGGALPAVSPGSR